MTHPTANCVIIGAGGHAAVLIDAIRRAGVVQLGYLLDRNPVRWNTDWLGIPIVGSDDMLGTLHGKGIRFFAVGVGRVGGGDRRQVLFEQAKLAGLEPATVVDPTSTLSGEAAVAEGAQILARAVVNAGARIGCNAVVNTAAVVEHDCIVGDHAFVAPGAILGGGVTVGSKAFIGLGAIVLPGVAIGEDAVVGAGAVVNKTVPPAATVMGIPARVRELQS